MEDKKTSIYTCQGFSCYYTFSATETGTIVCPDCGSKKVKKASEEEIKLFLERLNIKKEW